MFIIWGTKTRRERLGVVADWCFNCRRVRAFTVSDYFRVPHVYYISLGRGTLTATARECWECGSQYYCAEEDYEDLLPEETAEQMSMNELLYRTNRSLSDRLDTQRQGQAESRRQTDAGNSGAEVLDALPADDEATA